MGRVLFEFLAPRSILQIANAAQIGELVDPGACT
jgi:hypothetical protein